MGLDLTQTKTGIFPDGTEIQVNLDYCAVWDLWYASEVGNAYKVYDVLEQDDTHVLLGSRY